MAFLKSYWSKQDAPEDAVPVACTLWRRPAILNSCSPISWGARTYPPGGHLRLALTLNLEPPAVEADDFREPQFRCPRFTEGKLRRKRSTGTC